MTIRITLDSSLKLAGLPPNLRESLIEALSFPNPKWLENKRMGRWNGGVPKELRFYDKVGQDGLWIPRGYMRRLLVTLRREGLSYDIDDQRRTLASIDLQFQGQLRDFQSTAVAQMARREFGTLCAPTGSGKTVMALNLISQRRQPALVVVHTKELAFQWIDRIQVHLGIDEAMVGLIGAGNKRISDSISVALVQSLYKCADEIASHVGHLIVDECHRAPSRTFTEAVTAFDCRYMLGLTATPWRRDRLSKLIFWHLGDVHHQVQSEELVAKGHILSARVIWRPTAFEPFYDPVNEYSKMLAELTSDDMRNRGIVSDIDAVVRSGAGGICLVLSDRKKHCDVLKGLLKYRHGIEAALLTGDLNTDQRKSVLERLRAGKEKVVVATGQLIGEGFDCPDLATLFLATPIRFSGRLIQYLGRILRPAEGKVAATVYDYVDIKVPALVNGAEARRRVYPDAAPLEAVLGEAVETSAGAESS
ncbi:MAG: DEAD/DEAH box helicase [Desulfosarcinaceae bacterium]|nr:DEAD/DEAH box helicase [Desulfosarcinaceae bacterium]